MVHGSRRADMESSMDPEAKMVGDYMAEMPWTSAGRVRGWFERASHLRDGCVRFKTSSCSLLAIGYTWRVCLCIYAKRKGLQLPSPLSASAKAPGLRYHGTRRATAEDAWHGRHPSRLACCVLRLHPCQQLYARHTHIMSRNVHWIVP
jgi:hypothetical protein